MKHRSLPATAVIDRSMIKHLYRYVPRSVVVEILAGLKLPFPAELPEIGENEVFPTDITRVDNTHLRQLYSYWTAQFARVNALLSLTRGERKVLTRKADRIRKRIFLIYAPTSTRSVYVDAVWGNVYKHVRVIKVEKELDNATRLEEALEGLANDFKLYADLCSREMTWRINEMQRIGGSRGGP